MFETTLSPPRVPAWSTGSGALVSVAAHAAILVTALALTSSAPRPQKAAPVDVTLRLAPPPPPPPPLGGGAAHTEAPKKPVPVKKDSYVHTNVESPPRPPDPAPAATGESGGKEDGVPGGKEGGSRDGILGGEVGGTGTVMPSAPPPPPPPPPTNVVLAFGEGMTRPQLIGGPQPVYPSEARTAKVEGTMLVKCVITSAGTLRNCRILKSLPFLDQPVLEALSQQHYTPVTFQGRPVDVEYVIPLRFKIQ